MRQSSVRQAILAWVVAQLAGCDTVFGLDPRDAEIPAARNRAVFVSSMTSTGNFGGIDGADASCQRLATDAGLSGSFAAWLSNTTRAVADRMTHDGGPFLLTNGTLVANDWKDLTDATIAHAINVTESQGTVMATLNECGGVWTGTDTAGNATSTATTSDHNNCDDWTMGTASVAVQYGMGSEDLVDRQWTEAFCVWPCSKSFRLYCIEQ